MNDEFERSGRSKINVFSWHLPGGIEESYEKPVRIAGVTTETGTEHPSNISPECYG
jgi:hypothetical protein